MLQDRAGRRPRDAPVMHENHVHLADALRRFDARRV